MIDIDQDKQVLQNIIDAALDRMKAHGLVSGSMLGDMFEVVENELDSILKEGVKTK